MQSPMTTVSLQGEIKTAITPGFNSKWAESFEIDTCVTRLGWRVGRQQGTSVCRSVGLTENKKHSIQSRNNSNKKVLEFKEAACVNSFRRTSKEFKLPKNVS